MPHIHLTVTAGSLLFRFFYNVESFNKDSNDTKKFEPYSIKQGDDQGRFEVEEIEKWMHKRIIRRNPLDPTKYSISEYKGKINANHIKRLKKMAEHYEGAGNLIINCSAYNELLRCLDGKEAEQSDIELEEPEICADMGTQAAPPPQAEAPKELVS